VATSQVVHVVFGLATGETSATVERGLSATGPWVPIGTVGLVSDEGYFYDNTAPFDVPVWYRATRTSGPIVLPGPLTLVGDGAVVLSDPLRPWADIEFRFCETTQDIISLVCSFTGPELVWARFGDRVRASDAGLFPILDAERPADVYARRKDHEGSGLILTRSLAAIDRMTDLFTVGGPLFLRAPAAYGRTDFHIQPGELTEAFLGDRIDQRKPVRLWSFPYVVVDGPLGPQQGTECANWCALSAAFPTYATLTATGDTWGEIAAGTTVCP